MVILLTLTNIFLLVLYIRARRHLDIDYLTGLASAAKYKADSVNVKYKEVMVIDLAGLKAVKDTYGHAAGSKLIGEFGHALKEAVRESDMVYRYGGDEFVVLFTNKVSHSAIVERIRAKTSIPFSAGFGANFNEADAAMYRDKIRGRQ
jgi:diguanylate cyclase (GGDEF)-like protein